MSVVRRAAGRSDGSSRDPQRLATVWRCLTVVAAAPSSACDWITSLREHV